MNMENNDIKFVTADIEVSKEKLNAYDYFGWDALKDIKRNFAKKIAEQIADFLTIETTEKCDSVEYYACLKVRDMLKKEN